MKQFYLLLIFISLYSSAFSQIIKGTILEKGVNNTPIFATIYFNGTFVGTFSDQNGIFELDISKNKSMPLTISAIGYYSVTLTEFLKTKPLVIYLQPKIYKLEEATVNAKSLSRKRRNNLRLFRDEFEL